jgi:hypothetical protein
MRKVLVVALSLTMFCTACSTAWVSTLDSILAAAAPALVDILQIVAIANGQPLNNTLAAKINTDATAIKTLATDFAQASASAASAPGACEALQTAVGVYQADQVLVLQVAQVSDSNTRAKITLLADLVAGTIQAITAVIPSCQNAAARSFEAPPPYSVTGFTDRYNRVLIAPTGNEAMDAATGKLRLHRHSRFVRSITLGRLD